MSDDGSAVVEKKGRGRPKLNTNGTVEAKGEPRKRGRPPTAAKVKESNKSSDDEQAPVAKRGRARPKGSKKKVAAKTKSAPVPRGRGRPRKDGGKKEAPPKKDASSEEEEDDDQDDEEGSDQ